MILPFHVHLSSFPFLFSSLLFSSPPHPFCFLSTSLFSTCSMFSPLRARSLSVQASSSVQASMSAQVARFFENVQSSQAPRLVQESAVSNLNHVFPHLAFTPSLEADPYVSVPVPSPEPSPGDSSARLEEGQVFEPQVRNPEIPAQPVSNTFNAQETPADTYSGSSRVT